MLYLTKCCSYEREIVWSRKKKGNAMRNAVLKHSGVTKPENFLSLNKSYWNISKKHETTAMMYLTKCYSYECVR
jgi:hypothetical protein